MLRTRCDRFATRSFLSGGPSLTNLYNARPQWLVDAHAQLDAAVAAAYGWPADITNDAALDELLDRNRRDGIPAGESGAP